VAGVNNIADPSSRLCGELSPPELCLDEEDWPGAIMVITEEEFGANMAIDLRHIFGARG
jgi:hypothetical protein